MTMTVQPDKAGIRVDSFVSECTEYSRSFLQKMIEDGLLLVNGKTITKSYKTQAGDEITIIEQEPEILEVTAENIPLDIIYEDDDLIVINKAKGMVVHPAAGNYNGTLVNALMYHCGDSLSGIGGVMRPGIVHRIDKMTSGLLVVAKNDFAHNFLSEQIKEHKVSRVYHAIASGNIKENITLDYPIGRSVNDRKKMDVTYKNSKPAITHVEVIDSFGCATYVKCILETGRTHQIRVHLSHIGHPILGDDVYGGIKNIAMQKCGKALEGQCLHAKELTFIHPRTNEECHFECPLPEYFKITLDNLYKTRQ